MSWNDKKVVFVPGCMLCPAFQACPSEKNTSWQWRVIELLVNKHINIIQMPCPEVSFQGYIVGMARLPHGVGYYEHVPGFAAHCKKLGQKVVDQVVELTQAGSRVVAIIGVEHSPTCATSYMRTNHGMEKRKGIYMQVINDEIIHANVDVPIIGVNRRWPEKFMRNIRQICGE